MNMNRLAVALTAVNLVLLIVLLIQSRAIADQTVPDVLRVRSFELVDEAGKVRAQLNVEPSGEVVFRLRGEDESIRVKLGASTKGSGLVLIDDQTEPGVQILAQQDGTSLTLTDQSGAKQIIEP
ncbi:MAG TPA: hypothetical protein VK880_14000 [Anaerolineales bacterium]|nr:hypothetical protein [Anaerolineales bacterium]